MIKVYFEQKGYAELVAFFDSEDIYHACLPALEKKAKENHFEFITESVVDVDLSELDIIVDTM